MGQQPIVESVRGPAPVTDANFTWETLCAIPGVGITVFSVSDGVCHFASHAARQIYFGRGTSCRQHCSLKDVFPIEWAEERLGYFRRAAESREPVVVREIWRGRQLCTIIRPIEDEDGEVRKVLMVTRPTEDLSTLQSFGQIENSSYVELGPLDVLTSRELTVLALLGAGLTLKEIAERLHRSFKTIDNHRASIGRKLQKTDRLALAKLASQAGLTVRDVDRERVRYERKPA